MLHDVDHLAHVPTIYMITDSVEGGRPSLIRQLGEMRKQPLEDRLWGAHPCMIDQENTTDILQELKFPSSSERRLVPKYCAFDARGYGMQKEEVEPALIRWSLCSCSKLYYTFQREKDHGQRRRAYQLS